MDLILSFLGGMLLCNSLPHLVSGLRGETFYTPWAKPRGIGHSSALENFLWGSANLVLGAVLVGPSIGVATGQATAALGFVLGGVGLSLLFGRRRAGREAGDRDR